jgi:His-Xaa-Ser system radical SAM maturase HxsC
MRLWAVGTALGITQSVMGKLITRPIDDRARRRDHIAYGSDHQLLSFGGELEEYAGVLCRGLLATAPRIPAIHSAPNLEYLSDGDVVRLSPDGSISVLYRRSSHNNTILTTERCNSFCLMCSQPPKTADDSYRVGMILRLLELIDQQAGELIVSGGEPTLLGDGFLDIIEKARVTLPQTGLHVLTNGRLFKNKEFTKRLAAIGHHDLMLGIPLYSDVPELHDYVVQAAGAFEETIDGLYNLAASGVRLELRVVLHKQTYERLPRLAEFITRNLPFVEHVALMGLEMFGFTPRNLDVLWIDPVDYAPELEEAALGLATRGMNVSIYNHQLCTIPRSLWPYARKSISDCKNVYLPTCDPCGVKDFCGGFFQSATKRHSAHVAPCVPLTGKSLAYMQQLHNQIADSAAFPG